MKETNSFPTGHLYALLTAFALISLSGRVNAEKIAIFYNPAYVHIEQGNLFAEGSNLTATLEAQGHELITFEEVTEAALLEAITQANLLIIPELEIASLVEDLNENSREFLRQYIALGGGLIIHGVVAAFTHHNNNAVELLNQIFDFSLQHASIELLGNAVLNPSGARGTAFQAGPGTIGDNNANAYLAGRSLPAGSRKIYTKADNPSAVCVAMLPYELGEIVYLGWSWWNAWPAGQLDNGWVTVLNEAIQEVACPFDVDIQKTTLTMNLNNDGTLRIQPEDLGEITVACGALASVQISPNTFSCDQLGHNDLVLTIEDQLGRKVEKQLTLTLTDDQEFCVPGPQSLAVSGTIRTENGEGIAQTIITVDETDIAERVTTGKGNFHFENLEFGKTYRIKPVKDIDPLNGVSTFDIHLIRKHIMGVQQLDSPYKMIAADVNHSGSITAEDLLQIRHLLLNITQEFPESESWRFVDAGFDFPDYQNPFATAFPEDYQLNVIPDDGSVDFIGVKIGDVDQSAAVSRLTGLSTRQADQTLSIKLGNKLVHRGERIEVPFIAGGWKEIEGFQLSLQWDPGQMDLVKLPEVDGGFLSLAHFGLDHIDRGVLTVSWDDLQPIGGQEEQLFQLVFVAKTDGQLSDLLSLSRQSISAQAFDANATFYQLELSFNEPNQSGPVSQLYQNYPNPFRESTNIDFTLAEGGEVVLQVLDASGRTLKTFRKNLPPGNHTVQLKRDELNSTSNILFYRLETELFTAVKKLAIVRE